MTVHYFELETDARRCRFCHLSAFKIKTDREDISDAIACLEIQAETLDHNQLHDMPKHLKPVR